MTQADIPQPSMDQTPVVHWVRRDLRISDNTALLAASNSGAPVIPVHFLSGWSGNHDWTGPKRQHFLCGCLQSFSKNLETIGGRLIIRHKPAIDGLKDLITETGAKAVHYNQDPDPFGKQTELELQEACAELGVECHGYHDVALHGPNEVLTQQDEPYRVYTPYSKNWLNLEKAKPAGKPKNLNTPEDLPSEDLPTVKHWGLDEPEVDMVEPGEKAAQKRLKAALDGVIQNYSDKRNFPAEPFTSRLSQDLRFGLISIRKVYAAAEKAAENASSSGQKSIHKFIKELTWREFYFAILHHYPSVLDLEFNPYWQGLPWDEPNENFERWKQGKTGFPIVDAGMRELLATGFMHNRVRMITAMFLTKDLHIDWRLGESFFMQHLIDGEIASNNGGWQWSAGTGADAAPYFRIQNPWSQTKRYDPKGEYIKKWVPELADVDPKLFLDPPEDDQPIADDYPLPCVNHKDERERTLKIFKQHKEDQPK